MTLTFLNGWYGTICQKPADVLKAFSVGTSEHAHAGYVSEAEGSVIYLGTQMAEEPQEMDTTTEAIFGKI